VLALLPAAQVIRHIGRKLPIEGTAALGAPIDLDEVAVLVLTDAQSDKAIWLQHFSLSVRSVIGSPTRRLSTQL